MSEPNLPVGTIDLVLVGLHECNYLPQRMAGSLMVDPAHAITGTLFQTLLDHGFRRSGPYIYRPYCLGCLQCLATRLAVGAFVPNRSMRRIWRRNLDLTVSDHQPMFNREHYDLYRRYLAARHADGPMDNDTSDDYLAAMVHPQVTTRFHEFRCQGRLVMVAVVDETPFGLSAVYTFFDPELASRSLGTHAILWEIDRAQRMDKKWLYLGYWIANCQKMNYKTRFQPLQVRHGGRWIPCADVVNIDQLDWGTGADG